MNAPTLWLNRTITRLGGWNPQLYRELKSRFTVRTVLWLLGISVFCQGQLLFILYSLLPQSKDSPQTYPLQEYNRYCVGLGDSKWEQGLGQCTQDFLGQVQIDWQLWALDGFLVLAIISLLASLVGGLYLVVTDMQRETRRGTLDFVRLSPITEAQFVTGKVLGVPSVLYALGASTLPLQIILASQAGIPLPLLLAFYGVAGAGLLCFFLGALLAVGFNRQAMGQGAAIAGGVGLVLLIHSLGVIWSRGAMDPQFASWFTLWNPVKALDSVTSATFMAQERRGYFFANSLVPLRWYGMALGVSPWGGLGLMGLNFVWGSYWSYQGLKRRFRRPLTPPWSKRQSFALTLSFLAIANGYVFQAPAPESYAPPPLLASLGTWQLTLWIFFAVLTLALLPPQSYLKDWSRYHHAVPRTQRTWYWQTLREDHSPALPAIALNLALAALFSLPLLLLNLGNLALSRPFPAYSPMTLIGGFLMGLVWNLTLAGVMQWALARLTLPRWTIFLGLLGALAALPIALVGVLKLHTPAILWLSPLPILAQTPTLSLLFFVGLGFQSLLLPLSVWRFQRLLSHWEASRLMGSPS